MRSFKFLSRVNVVNIRTNAIVDEISRSPVDSNILENASNDGISSLFDGLGRAGK